MKRLTKYDWTNRSYRGNFSISTLCSDDKDATATIVHRPGAVSVKLAYFRAGVLKEVFLEIPDTD